MARITAPPALIWEVLTDVPHLHTWVAGVARASITTQGPLGVGTEIDVDLGRTAWRCEVTVWRHAEVLAVECNHAGVLFLGRAEISVDAGAVTIALRTEMSARRGPQPSSFWLGGQPSTADVHCQRSLEALLQRLELLTQAPYR